MRNCLDEIGVNMEQIPTTYQYKNDIFVSWEEKLCPFHLMTFASHNAYEIYILLEGERRVYIGDKNYNICAGNVIMIAANILHRSEGNIPYKGICIQFTEEQLDKYYTNYMKKQFLACFIQEVIELDKNTLAELQLCLYHMLGDSKRKAFYLPTIFAFLQRIIEGADNPKSFSEKDNISKTIYIPNIENYLQKNACKIKGLEDIAEHFGITKEYLCTIFKKQTGITVISYLNNIKIQEACKLLTATNYSVEEISVYCGFQSPIYFHRLFKKLMNHTPAKYRIMIRQSHKVKKEDKLDHILC